MTGGELEMNNEITGDDGMLIGGGFSIAQR
jgi:hypothetical protein